MLKEYAIHHYSKDDVDKSIDWLENRVKFLRPQPKQEWSIEDEKIWNHIIDCAESGAWIPFNEISWLVAHKPQFYWKPSKEQIKAIRLAKSFVVDDFDEHPTLSEILMELEEQLKKLM